MFNIEQIAFYFIIAMIGNQKLFRHKAYEIEETVYFDDGKRKIDAILVYQNKPCVERDEFLKNLQSQKIQIETASSVVKPGRMFIKVHAPDEVLLKYIKVFNLEQKFQRHNIIPYSFTSPACCRTILTEPDPSPNEPASQRAWAIVSREPPSTFTDAERSTILFAIMRYVTYGKDQTGLKVGITDLVNRKIFIAAYPLHDGKWEWSNESPTLTSRQLLAKYWADCGTWYKAQPYYHIEDYFGPEIAMYFAFIGYYNKMLVLASCAGFATFGYGLFHILKFAANPIKGACTSTIYMCPTCRICKSKQLSYYCFSFKLAYLMDNPASVVYAFFISFWATSFIEYWKRKTNLLNLMWRIREASDIDENYRGQFQTTVKQTRRHSYTGEQELYVHPFIRFVKLVISITLVTIMLLVVVATVLAVISYETILKRIEAHPVITVVSSSFLTLVVMKNLAWVFRNFAHCLTNIENPRTQLEFDKSFMLKTIVFSMVNSYSKLIYIAFFKGKFFTYPGDRKVRESWFPLSASVCDPAGCVADLFIFSCVINIFRPIFDNILEYLCPVMKHWYKATCKRKRRFVPSWERDFELNPISRYTIMSEVAEMVLQYGFVVLLAAPFPLAPLCALVNNIFEIKIDATKLLKFHRRAKAVRVVRMGVWFDALQALTYFGVITNALYIGLTSNFVPEHVYYFYVNGNLSNLYIFQMSKYANNDSYWPNTNVSECMYIGQRNPPESEKPYELSHLNYYILTYRLAICLIFMITVFGCTAVLAYAIPDIPKKVTDYISFKERTKLKKNVQDQFEMLMNR